MCYTYDSLSRVTTRTIRKTSDNSVISTEMFCHDAAGNITDAPDSCFAYDTNNRLVTFNSNAVSYDTDGNMLSNGSLSYTYDSANRLVSAGGHTYTYNAEDVRTRNLCAEEDTTYTYNTNAKLSMLLMKTTNGVVTKYVYGRGLIGEENGNIFKTYHFDCRGSTIAITDASGNITDTFAYDTYGKLISRTGTSKVIFGYNGRDGVVTDDNGLIYMRARYYSPEMKRFINADVIAGAISNAITLNRFAYANGNPVSNIDPFGLTTVAIFSGGETDLDPTDDYECGSSGSGGYAGYGTSTSGYGYSSSGWSGYDPSVSSGGSYHNYLVSNGTANYDALHGGYHYQGTNTSFSNVGQYYVPGAVSVDDSMAIPSNDEIIRIAIKEANKAYSGNGHVVGTYKHAKFAEVIRSYKRPSLKAEVSYKDGHKVTYSQKGSIRFDAIEYDSFRRPVRAWDFKTGNATLTQSRIHHMQNQSG